MIGGCRVRTTNLFGVEVGWCGTPVTNIVVMYSNGRTLPICEHHHSALVDSNIPDRWRYATSDEMSVLEVMNE